MYFANINGFYYLLFYIDIDECASEPCQNNATCTQFLNGYNCTCVDGYTGDNCETGKLYPNNGILNALILQKMF